MITVDEASFLLVVVAAAASALIVAALPRRLAPPVVVVELLVGILIGPQVLGIAEDDAFIDFFSNLGLGMLFFFAGYEIELARIRGRPLNLGAAGWALSVALAYAIGGVLAAAGVVLSLLYAGSAMATTAIGTLIPILRDSGELRTRFGTYLLGAGAVGEFGPILLVTVVLSTAQPLHEAVVLTLFVALAVLVAISSVRLAWRGWPLLERTLEASSQLAVRLAVLLVFGLAALASELGLDILLGGFVAGMITRAALRGREVTALESKLTGLGFGFLVPFFFVVSGMEFGLDALTSSAGAMLKLPLFLTLFLVVRGAPALLLYRGVIEARDRLSLALFSATQLPLVVAITTLATDGGHMRSSTAAALVGAAMISTLVFPFIALARAYAAMLRVAHDLDGDDARWIAEARRRWEGHQHPPHVEMTRLQQILAAADNRFSQIYPIVQGLFLWDIHVLDYLERWQLRCGREARGWIATLGELEALCGFARLADDHPEWTFPHIAEDLVLRAEAIGHPLMHPKRAVTNDVTIGPRETFLLVTGSNMSGKSTLLRAIGVNAVLGLAGAPVCAKRLDLPPVRVWTSMRVRDSLDQGVSYFMAGLRRLKAVVEAARDNGAARPSVLFLLDEILQGTNTAERLVAVRGVVAELVERGAIGAVTTHDLSLADAPELKEILVPVHFTESFQAGPNGGITFDYKLLPGVATSRNALRLMELMGLRHP